MVSASRMEFDRALFESGGSLAVRVPIEVITALGLETGSEVKISLMEGRHGKFIAIWKGVK